MKSFWEREGTEEYEKLFNKLMNILEEKDLDFEGSDGELPENFGDMIDSLALEIYNTRDYETIQYDYKEGISLNEYNIVLLGAAIIFAYQKMPPGTFKWNKEKYGEPEW